MCEMTEEDVQTNPTRTCAKEAIASVAAATFTLQHSHSRSEAKEMHRLPVVVHLIAVGYGRNIGQPDPEGHDQDRQRRAPNTEDLLGVLGRGRPARHVSSRLDPRRPSPAAKQAKNERCVKTPFCRRTGRLD